jgi:hypothetical protein
MLDCLIIREKKQPDDWTTFTTKSMLGEALNGQKKRAEAEPLLVQGLRGALAACCDDSEGRQDPTGRGN